MTIGRPPKHQDSQIVAAYNRTPTMRAFAKVLKVSLPTAYKYANRLELPTKRMDGRPDLRKFTDDQLRAAREKQPTIAALATELGCCQKTVRKHLERLGVSYERPIVPASTCAEVFNRYKGLVTIRDLAAHFGLTLGAVRSSLDRHVHTLWGIDARSAPRLPRPRNHQEIKVYHALVANPRTTADTVSSAFNIAADVVSAYMARRTSR